MEPILPTEIFVILNQVLEKQALGLTAVNLTKNTFNREVLRDLNQNYYSFVYLVGFNLPGNSNLILILKVVFRFFRAQRSF